MPCARRLLPLLACALFATGSALQLLSCALFLFPRGPIAAAVFTLEGAVHIHFGSSQAKICDVDTLLKSLKTINNDKD